MMLPSVTPTTNSSLARKPTRTTQASRHAIVANAYPRAIKPTGAEHSGRGHSDIDSVQARAGVCNIVFETTSGTHVIKAPKAGANVYSAADHAGLHLPASCKQGSCSSCVGKCLTPSLKAQGYVALCCASVAGDATILTHQGAKLRAARALQLDRMRHKHG